MLTLLIVTPYSILSKSISCASSWIIHNSWGTPLSFKIQGSKTYWPITVAHNPPKIWYQEFFESRFGSTRPIMLDFPSRKLDIICLKNRYSQYTSTTAVLSRTTSVPFLCRLSQHWTAYLTTISPKSLCSFIFVDYHIW